MTPRERFLRATAGKDVDRPPVWLMRQAGRYLPEYRELRDATTFEKRLTSPDLATEITLQPLRRFPLDAAIVFSDILVPLTGMGRPARFDEHGPHIDHPVRTPEDVASLREPECARDSPYLIETLQRVRKERPDHALLGFAGAPFTLAAYLIDGGGASKGFQQTKRFAYAHTDAWHALMRHCAAAAAEHLRAQLEAGCDAVQLFDTWAEILAPAEYEEFVLPHVRHVFASLPRSATSIYFARGTPHLSPMLPKTGARVWSIDWRASLADVRAAHPGVPLQGNLDPTLLFAPRERIERETRAMLDALGGRAHVANLGHGILPGTPIEGVQAFIETVTTWNP